MELYELNPHIRYAMMNSSLNIPPHRISVSYDCRLFYFLQGSGCIRANGTDLIFTDGTAIYLPPCSHYSFFFDSETSARAIVFNFDLVSDHSHIDRSLGTATPSSFDAARVPNYAVHRLFSSPLVMNAPHFASSLGKCCELFLKQPPFFRESASARLKLCLIDMVSEHPAISEYSPMTAQVLAYIKEHCAEPSLTNAEIAANSGYSAYHLNRLISSETGRSIHAHLLCFRLELAKNFLLSTDFPITEIAWKTGFSSASYFVKSFRTSFGVTPNAYRKINATSGV